MAEIPGGITASLGGKTTKVLFAKDAHNNQVLSGGAAVSVTYDSRPVPVSDLGNGSYSFSYEAGTAAGCRLEATVNGVSIAGSPFTVQLASKQIRKFKGIPMVDTESLIKLITDASDVVQRVTTYPETFAAADCSVSPDALRESFALSASDVAPDKGGWDAAQVEAHANALAGELGLVARLLQAHKTYKVDAVIAAAAALQNPAAAEAPVEPPAGTPAEVVAAIRDAAAQYDEAKASVAEALANVPHELAHRVDTRGQKREAYETALRTNLPLIPDPPASTGEDGEDGEPASLADLLEKIPAGYGSKIKQMATSAVDAMEESNASSTGYG